VPSEPRWRTELGWFFISRAPPTFVEDMVVVRCGHDVVALARKDGALRWRSEVEPECGDGAFFLPLPSGGWLTDFHRWPERLTSVVAIGSDGSRRWRADLPAIGAARGAVLDGEALVLPAKQPGAGQRLFVFDAPATGGGFTNVALAWGVSSVVIVGGELVVANAMGGEAGRGLYRVRRDGGEPIVLAAPSAIDVAKVDDRTVVAAMKEANAITVAAIDIEDGTQRWSAAASAQWVAVAGGRSITVEDSRPVGRDAISGDVVWTGDVLDGTTNSIAVAGDLAIVAAGRSRVVLEVASGRSLGRLSSAVGAVAVDEDAIYVAVDRSVVCYPRS
jgi:hypothetical protein